MPKKIDIDFSEGAYLEFAEEARRSKAQFKSLFDEALEDMAAQSGGSNSIFDMDPSVLFHPKMMQAFDTMNDYKAAEAKFLSTMTVTEVDDEDETDI